MSYCKKCGAQINENSKVCPQCGTSLRDPSLSDKINDAWEKFNDTDDMSSSMEMNDIDNNKLISVLAYLSLLVLIPLFARKDSPFARFHSNQGLVLLICNVVIGILTRIPVIRIFAWILEIAAFVLAIIGIINVANGKAKELPIIGKIHLLN